MATPKHERNEKNDKTTQTLDALVKAQELALYTIRICSNKRTFDPQFNNFMTQDVVNTAKDVYLLATQANNIMVQGDADRWRLRRSYQERAVAACNRLLGLIDLSKRLFNIRGRRIAFWSQLTVDARSLLRAWMESDRKRYGDLS